MLSILGLSLLSACNTTNRATYDEAVRQWQRHNYFQAYHEIVQVQEANPDDETVQQLYAQMQRDYLLWQARNSIFGNDEIEALGFLEQVLTRDPQDPEALGLRAKARNKLAARAVADARNLKSRGELEKAFQRYNEALSYDRANIEAEEGLAELDATWGRLREAAEDRRLRGLRNLAEGRVERADYEFAIARRKDPHMETLDKPAARAAREIAEQQFAYGKKAEDEGYYNSALSIFEVLYESNPDLPGLEERLERAREEAEARSLFGRAEVAIFRGEFEKAREFLARAAELSKRQLGDISLAQLLVTEREAELRSTQARDEDLEGNLQVALGIYNEIRDTAPQGLEIEARIEDLQIRIDEATRAYDEARKAESVGDTETALNQYGVVELFWPGYQDAAERRAALLGVVEPEAETPDAPERPEPVRIEPFEPTGGPELLAPTVEGPTDTSVGDQPVNAGPVSEEPVTEEPVTEEPVTEEPVSGEPEPQPEPVEPEVPPPGGR